MCCFQHFYEILCRVFWFFFSFSVFVFFLRHSKVIQKKLKRIRLYMLQENNKSFLKTIYKFFHCSINIAMIWKFVFRLKITYFDIYIYLKLFILGIKFLCKIWTWSEHLKSVLKIDWVWHTLLNQYILKKWGNVSFKFHMPSVSAKQFMIHTVN